MNSKLHAFQLLESQGFYREAVKILKHGDLTCGLGNREYTVAEILNEYFHSSVSRDGRYERFTFK